MRMDDLYYDEEEEEDAIDEEDAIIEQDNCIRRKSKNVPQVHKRQQM